MKQNIQRSTLRKTLSIVSVIFAIQFVVISIFGILLLKDKISLHNYRALQDKQIEKVAEDCNNKISNGISANEELTRQVIRTLAKVVGSNPDTLENIYLRDLSMGYCRASEFVLQGIQNVNGRAFIRGDFLFGSGDAPRKITSETFGGIRW